MRKIEEKKAIFSKIATSKGFTSKMTGFFRAFY